MLVLVLVLVLVQVQVQVQVVGEALAQALALATVETAQLSPVGNLRFLFPADHLGLAIRRGLRRSTYQNKNPSLDQVLLVLSFATQQLP